MDHTDAGIDPKNVVPTSRCPSGPVRTSGGADDGALPLVELELVVDAELVDEPDVGAEVVVGVAEPVVGVAPPELVGVLVDEVYVSASDSSDCLPFVVEISTS